MAARALSVRNNPPSFPTSIVYAGLSGEEQGLYGGQHMARVAKDEGWEIVGIEPDIAVDPEMAEARALELYAEVMRGDGS